MNFFLIVTNNLFKYTNKNNSTNHQNHQHSEKKIEKKNVKRKIVTEIPRETIILKSCRQYIQLKKERNLEKILIFFDFFLKRIIIYIFIVNRTIFVLFRRIFFVAFSTSS